jgi:CelD/BcsL family acetyltransferase involved in cellulose biosynthesis
MVEQYDSVGPVRAQWDDLANRCGAMPWLRPGWFVPWWSQFGRGRLAIVALRRGGQLVGVLPLMARAGVRASLANWHTPGFAPIAESDRDREELARALLLGRTRRVELRFLDRDDRGLAACRAAAGAAHWRVIERTLESSPYLEIRGDWDGYAQTKRGAFLADMRRRWRRLEERGHVTVEVRDGTERLDALLDDGFRVEGSGWKTQRGTAIASRPETDRFYREVARWAAESGWLRLAFLRLEGRAVAFHFNILYGGVHYNLKGGYDPEYGRFAPGRLLHREMIERAHGAGLRSYEFLGAAEPWKLEWTTSTRDRQIFQAFPTTPVGTAEWAAFAYGRPLARRALAWRDASRPAGGRTQKQAGQEA